MLPSRSQTSQNQKWGIVASVAAIGVGATLAIAGLRRLAARACAAPRPRLNRQDTEAISRMEGEGGPSAGLAPQQFDAGSAARPLPMV